MIKNSEDIKGMRVAGKLAAQTLEMIGEHVKPGISTGELDKICHDYIVDEIDCIPAPLNYKGFPKSICKNAFIEVLNKLSQELDWVTLVMPFKSMPKAIIIQS